MTKLCALSGIKASKDNVARCKLKHFDKLKAAELKAFNIASNNPKYNKLLDIAHLKNPRGGQSIEVATNGVDNCILVAFGVHNEKSCLLANTERQEEDTNVVATSTPLISKINLCSLKMVKKSLKTF